MKPHLQCAEQQVSRSNLTKYCACHAERLTYLIIITYETSFRMRGATGVTIQPHQILRLSRKKTRILSSHRIWNVIYSARSNRCHHPTYQILRLSRRKPHILSPHRIWNVIYSARSNKCREPTSPNTAPATKNNSTALSSSHMKRHFQCAEQQVSLSNLTKYCACHEKWRCKISKQISKNRWNVISNAEPIPPWSEHDPRMIRPWSEHENANRNPPRNRGYFSSSPRAFSIEKYNVSRPILHSNLHHILRLPRKVTLERHQVLRLPQKVTLELHQVLRLPQKVTLELHQVLRLPRKVTLELHQVLRLPRKMTLQDVKENLPKQVKRHFQCGADPSMIREWSDHDPSMKTQTATRLATEVTFRAHHEHFLLKNTTFRAQSYIQTFTTYCACHEKWHLNVTKYCACHEKWHLNFTKYCACHKKWH